MKSFSPSLIRKKQMNAIIRLFSSSHVSQGLTLVSTLLAFTYIAVEMSNAHIQNDIKH